MAMSTQWRWTGGMESRRAGLEYTALDVVCAGLAIGRKRRAAMFRGLQVMEAAALDIWRKAEK